MKRSNWNVNSLEAIIESVKNQPETLKEKKERLENFYGPLPEGYFNLSSSEQEKVRHNNLIKMGEELEEFNKIRPYSPCEKYSKDKIEKEKKESGESINWFYTICGILCLVLWFWMISQGPDWQGGPLRR